MMPCDFSHLNQDNMAFSDILLAKSDLKRLRFLCNGNLYGDFRDDLCKLGLAEEIRETISSGGMPKPTGKIRITDRGRSYLRYRNRELLRVWIPIFISALSLAVSIAAYFRSI